VPVSSAKLTYPVASQRPHGRLQSMARPMKCLNLAGPAMTAAQCAVTKAIQMVK
jgi:hypothetical protein